MKIHLCPVSAQPMPNYLGAMCFKPDKIVWLYTPAYENVMLTTENMIREKQNITFEKELVDPYKPDMIQRTCHKLTGKYSDDDLALNATCGTKIMSMSALEAFRQKGLQRFYIDTEFNRIINLQTGTTESIRYSMTINDYIRLHGQTVNSWDNYSPAIRNRAELSQFLLNNQGILSDFLHEVRQSKDDRTSWRFDKKSVYIVISKKPGTGNVSVTFKPDSGKKNTIEIPFAENNYIFGGGWLEEAVFINCMKKSYDDVCINLKLDYSRTQKRDDCHVKNEIDVAVCHKCKLYLISCKTGNFTKDSVFELFSISNMSGGLFGKSTLLLQKHPGNYFIERARDLYINVVTGNGISGFVPV